MTSEQLSGKRNLSFPRGDLGGSSWPLPRLTHPFFLPFLADESKLGATPPASSDASFKVIERGCLERGDENKGGGKEDVTAMPGGGWEGGGESSDKESGSRKES